MQILYDNRRPTVFTGAYSEVYTYGKALEILKGRLNDRYAIYVKHLDSAYQVHLPDDAPKTRIMIHISNEVFYDDTDYEPFDFVFRFYLPQRCDGQKVFPIPLGVSSHGKVDYDYGPNLPLHQRSNNLFFKGQIHHREAFAAALKQVSIPNSLIEFTDGFRGGDDLASYHHKLDQSKIILVPGGLSPETFRYAEAFARGCCVITDEPPGQWWHEGSPARFIQDWNQVGEVIQETLASMSETTHLDNRRYYYQKLSPKAIADYIEGVVREACSSKVA